MTEHCRSGFSDLFQVPGLSIAVVGRILSGTQCFRGYTLTRRLDSNLGARIHDSKTFACSSGVFD